MLQHVIVRDHQSSWALEYSREKSLITSALGDNCIAVYHIGSTAVPGLAAKPIVDMMVAVRSLARADEARARFEAAGYEWMGEFGIEGRRYLRKGGDERTHQIHIFQGDDWDSIIRHLAFRDYMRTHTEAREEYGRIKNELALRFPYDIGSYCDGKDEFVKRMERSALEWYDDTWDRLYLAARMRQGEWSVSPFIDAGSVAAALLASNGRIYCGVCIDSACSLGMCAERSAIAAMLTDGENKIRALAAVMPDGNAGMPCGSCRELMMQLDAAAGNTMILTDYETKKHIRLSDLMPDWWGTERFLTPGIS